MLHVQGWEIVIFTETPGSFAMDTVEKMDKYGVIVGKLFRDSCRSEGSLFELVTGGGRHVKDLSHLNRNLDRVIYIDDEADLSDQPANLLQIKAWDGDPDDSELDDLHPFFEDILRADLSAAKEKRAAPSLRKRLARYKTDDGVRVIDNFMREREERKKRSLAATSGLAGKRPKAKTQAAAAETVSAEGAATKKPGTGRSVWGWVRGSSADAEEKRKKQEEEWALAQEQEAKQRRR
jgi:TFIIF-interacting CTD phosphatases, including NLI-interacting factor